MDVAVLTLPIDFFTAADCNAVFVSFSQAGFSSRENSDRHIHPLGYATSFFTC